MRRPMAPRAAQSRLRDRTGTDGAVVRRVRCGTPDRPSERRIAYPQSAVPAAIRPWAAPKEYPAKEKGVRGGRPAQDRDAAAVHRAGYYEGLSRPRNAESTCR